MQSSLLQKYLLHLLAFTASREKMRNCFCCFYFLGICFCLCMISYLLNPSWVMKIDNELWKEKYGSISSCTLHPEHDKAIMEILV